MNGKRIGRVGIVIISVILLVVIGAGVFFSTSTTIIPHSPSNPLASNATVPPTATPIPVPTPKVIPEDLNIDCLNCGGNYALTLKLNTITIDYSNHQTLMKFTIKNTGATSCETGINKLEFQDDNGAIFKAQNVGQDFGLLGVGNPLIVNSIFDLLPQSNIHYLLNTSLNCTNNLDYKTQDFVLT